ncbi:MAG: Response regulator receiver modulated serine phosphatase [Chthoniobacter sp.]|nr:Response regulator receiver modulated serine phosphatase [Chthoniobacter sp.]
MVDDEAATRRMLERALQRLGFVVLSAANGQQALSLLETEAPDVMVLDFELPDMDGAEVCLKLRQSDRPELAELPIVLLTAHTGEEEEVRCLAAGANDYVTKPVSVAVLEARLRTQLRLRAMRTELQGQNAELEEWHRVRQLDLEAAQATQRAMIPIRPPQLQGWDIASLYQPLIQVGGDAFGWESLGKGRWLFWIADATGHGASAALLTALARLLFQHAGSLSGSPAEILRLVNQDFFAVFNGRSFMTAACAAVQVENGELTFSSAGHPPLLVLRDGGKLDRLEAGGTLLGLTERFEAAEETTLLARGDTALLYTDGLFSFARGEERMTLHDLAGKVTAGPTAQRVLEDTLRAVISSVGNAECSDDLAALALRRT